MSKTSRRELLKLGLVAGVGAAMGARSGSASAADLPALAETDATAAALGYKENSLKVDAKKFPNHKPDQNCANCKLILGDPKAIRRPCSIFPGKSVNAKGWCAAWAKA